LGGERPIKSAGFAFKNLKLPEYLALGLLGRMLLEGAARREEI
jgi:hypothetical protein